MQKDLTGMRARASRRGKAVRDKSAAAARKRNEDYLGARVPRELRERVIQRARDLGMPVSILIRNVLEEALGAARPGNVPLTPGAGRFPHVLGWEEILLNKSVDCAACGIRLNPGAFITLGLAGPGEEHVVLCQRCKHAA